LSGMSLQHGHVCSLQTTGKHSLNIKRSIKKSKPLTLLKGG
jgi:hypothetical protein